MKREKDKSSLIQAICEFRDPLVPVAQAVFDTSNWAQTGNSKAAKEEEPVVSQMYACPLEDPLRRYLSVGSIEIFEKKEHELKPSAV